MPECKLKDKSEKKEDMCNFLMKKPSRSEIVDKITSYRNMIYADCSQPTPRDVYNLTQLYVGKVTTDDLLKEYGCAVPKKPPKKPPGPPVPEDVVSSIDTTRSLLDRADTVMGNLDDRISKCREAGAAADKMNQLRSAQNGLQSARSAAQSALSSRLNAIRSGLGIAATEWSQIKEQLGQVTGQVSVTPIPQSTINNLRSSVNNASSVLDEIKCVPPCPYGSVQELMAEARKDIESIKGLIQGGNTSQAKSTIVDLVENKYKPQYFNCSGDIKDAIATPVVSDLVYIYFNPTMDVVQQRLKKYQGR